MQRGMLTLANPEVKLLVNCLAVVNQSYQPLLRQKIKQALLATEQSVSIELSEEEGNVLLDQLPPPTSSDPTVHSCREKLNLFLQKLHAN